MIYKLKALKASKKATLHKKLCAKCRDLTHCHYCGHSLDARGYASSWKFRKNGPQHCICTSCAE